MTVITPEPAPAAETNPSKYSKAFWADLADRSISTAAQSAIGTITASAVTGLFAVNFETVGSVAALATLLSVLKAFAVNRR